MSAHDSGKGFFIGIFNKGVQVIPITHLTKTMGAERRNRTRILRLGVESLVRGKLSAIGGRGGEKVAAFVLDMAGMAFDPLPTNRVLDVESIEAEPEVFVLHGVFLGCLPATLLPAYDPLVLESLDDVLGI